SQPEGVVFPLLQRLGAAPRVLRDRVDGLLDRIAKVYGSEAETYLLPALRKVLDRADSERQSLGDDYLSTEHLFLALLAEQGAVAALLKESGITRDAALGALAQIRGSQRITSQNPED